MGETNKNGGSQTRILNDAWSITMVFGLIITVSIIGYNTHKFGGNWDEYLVLSRVFQYLNGEHPITFRGLFVYGFGWLQWVNGLSLDRIEVARVSMWLLSIGTLVSLYSVGRNFFSQRGAMFVLLSYATFAYVFEHTASFRADPIITFFLVGAAALVLLTSTTAAIIAGCAIAIATLAWAKSILYFPAIGALVIYQIYREHRNGRRREAIRNGIITLLSFAISLIVLFVMHWLSLQGDTEFNSDIRWMSEASDKLLWSAGFFPRLDYAAHVATISYMFIFVWIVGLVITVKRVMYTAGLQRAASLALILMASPILSLFFYRNAFSYYYVFLLPLPALLCGVTIDSLRWNEKMTRGVRNVVLALILMGIGHGAWHTINENRSRSQNVQRALLSGIAEMFPEPVAYIDRCSMISDYPKSGFFMDTWRMEDYHTNGEPIMKDIIIEDKPKFALANHYALLLHLDQPESTYTLMPEDVQVLRANYVPHWELVFVAGKSITIEGSGERGFEILIPGTYTVETEGTVEIDDVEYQLGDFIDLESGWHTIKGSYDNQDVILRWGRKLAVPDKEMPGGPLFNGLM